MSPDTSSSSKSGSIPPGELPFRLRLTPAGRGTVEVAGVDLSRFVGTVALDARPLGTTRLVLELVGRDVDLEGVGEVHVVRRGDELASLLAGIDPDELEKEALRRLDGFDDRSTTAVMLEVLAEWLGGA